MKRPGKITWCASVVAVALGVPLIFGYFAIREKVSNQRAVIEFAGLRLSARHKSLEPSHAFAGTFVSTSKFTRGAWITCGDVILSVSYGKNFGSFQP